MSRRIFLIIIIVLLIFLIIGGYFLWLPKYQDFKDKKTRIKGAEEEIKQKEKHLSELESISAKLLAYGSEISKINAALPSEPSIAALFNFIQKTASENGLLLSDIDIGELSSLESSGEIIPKAPFSISVSGSYSSFKNFLSALYESSRFIEVTSIGFGSPEEKKGNIFIFDLGLQTHGYQP